MRQQTWVEVAGSKRDQISKLDEVRWQIATELQSCCDKALSNNDVVETDFVAAQIGNKKVKKKQRNRRLAN